MATFKVGQRVRAVLGARRDIVVNIGDQGVVIRGLGKFGRYHVRWDTGVECFSLPEALSPLTDPRAEEFIADMERYAHIAKDKVKA